MGVTISKATSQSVATGKWMKEHGFLKFPVYNATGPGAGAISKPVQSNAATATALAVAEATVQASMAEQPLSILLADELIDLELKLRAIDTTAITKRQTEIKTELRQMAEVEVAPEVSWTVHGTKGDIEISAVSMGTKITDPKGLFKKLLSFGEEAALDALSFTLAKVGKLLSENELDAFSTKVPGSRICKIKPKP